MKRPYPPALVFGLVALVGAALVGCSDSAAPTKAPEITGTPPKEWKDMTKQEKIDTINKQPMPEDAKRRTIDDINAGRQ